VSGKNNQYWAPRTEILTTLGFQGFSLIPNTFGGIAVAVVLAHFAFFWLAKPMLCVEVEKLEKKNKKARPQGSRLHST
jgi:hypothetical protein